MRLPFTNSFNSFGSRENSASGPALIQIGGIMKARIDAAGSPPTVGNVAGPAESANPMVDNGTTAAAGNRVIIIKSGTVTDDKGELRSIPRNHRTAAYVAVASDAGKMITITTGGVTINNSVFSQGDAVSIINQSGSDQTITQGSGFNLFNTADASTGNRTLAGRGMATMYFTAADAAYNSGAGLS